MSELTRILERVSRGEADATEELWRLAYDELRRMAAFKMAHEAPGQTLQATALVHEAWLRLGGDAQPGWKNRSQFFTAAAEAMRRILVERARSRAALKRGGHAVTISAEESEIPVTVPPDEELLAVANCEPWTRLTRLPLAEHRVSLDLNSEAFGTMPVHGRRVEGDAAKILRVRRAHRANVCTWPS